MKTKSFLLVTLLVASTAVRAQEPQAIPPEELAKATPLLMDANSRLGDLPLKLELAPDRATGFKAGEVGSILIPDRRLKTEKGDRTANRKNKGAATPVGQLWMLKLSPMEKGTALPNDKLRRVKISEKDKEFELVVFSLGIERTGKKGFQLALYGKDGAPVLRVPLTEAKVKGATPVTLSARRTGEEDGVLELKLLGRFKAEIPVGKPAA